MADERDAPPAGGAARSYHRASSAADGIFGRVSPERHIVFTPKEREAIMWEIGAIAMAVYRTLEADHTSDEARDCGPISV